MAEGAPTLEWRDARRDDRQQLQRFTCSSPDHKKWMPHRGLFHPRPWELDAQSAVRRLKPPSGARERIRVAHDDAGIAAVVHVAMATHDDHAVMLPVLASAQRLHRGPVRLGPEIAAEAIRCASELRRSLKLEGVGLFARVHPKNEASKRALSAAGFDSLGMMHLAETMPGPAERHQCTECSESWVITV